MSTTQYNLGQLQAQTTAQQQEDRHSPTLTALLDKIAVLEEKQQKDEAAKGIQVQQLQQEVNRLMTIVPILQSRSYSELQNLKLDQLFDGYYSRPQVQDLIMLRNENFFVNGESSPVVDDVDKHFFPLFPPAGVSEEAVESLYRDRIDYAKRLAFHPSALSLVDTLQYHVYFEAMEDRETLHHKVKTVIDKLLFDGLAPG